MADPDKEGLLPDPSSSSQAAMPQKGPPSISEPKKGILKTQPRAAVKDRVVERLLVQDDRGNVPLHYAVKHGSFYYFREVNVNAKATTMQNHFGNTPLHYSAFPNAGLYRLWELLLINPECVAISNNQGHTALQRLEFARQRDRFSRYAHGRKKKIVLLKLAENYGFVPARPPNDTMIEDRHWELLEQALAKGRRRGRRRRSRRSLLRQALVESYPSFIVEALVKVLYQKDVNGCLPLHIVLQCGLGSLVRLLFDAHPAAIDDADPVTGLFPIEQALLNVGEDASLENTDAVDTLLRAKPDFLGRIV